MKEFYSGSDDLSSLTANINSIKGRSGDTVDTALADGLADINALITQLEAEVENIAFWEDVDAINETLGGRKRQN